MEHRFLELQSIFISSGEYKCSCKQRANISQCFWNATKRVRTRFFFFFFFFFHPLLLPRGYTFDHNCNGTIFALPMFSRSRFPKSLNFENRVLERLWKVLEFLVEKSVRTLSNAMFFSACSGNDSPWVKIIKITIIIVFTLISLLMFVREAFGRSNNQFCGILRG